MFFEDFFQITDESKEAAVLCPFPHKTVSDQPYMESNPSAYVNTYDRVFHCMACNAGYNEVGFVQAVLNCSFTDARRLLKVFENTEYRHNWVEETSTWSQEDLSVVTDLGISEEVFKQLDGRVTEEGHMMFPVFMYDHVVGIRKYRPMLRPKLLARSGDISGLILPYDLWRQSKKTRVTILCAGEKDMAVARTMGFNAITLTGGEMMLPKLLGEFVGRTVAICYDNDASGMNGAKRVAQALYPIAESVKIVTGFHEVCVEKGEDLTDFFTKYHGTREDFIQYIENTTAYVPTPEELQQCYPVVDLLTASKSQYINKLVRSNIQVVAVSESSFVSPTVILAEKKQEYEGLSGSMALGDERTWELGEHNIQDLLHLLDNNFKETTIAQNVRDLLRIPQKEKGVHIRQLYKQPVYKAQVTDLFEFTSIEAVPMEYTAYSLNMKLESGKKYMVTYKLVPHPYKGQQLTMLITNATQASDSVAQFRLTDDVVASLKSVTDLEGTVTERMDYLAEAFKGILGYNGNNTLIQAIDLAYHTVLQFNFGAHKVERGYLDTLIVGESRVGKSSTASAMQETYGLGTFTSLAGNSATIAGLIGGSNKVNGSFQTRAGVIPQNHRGLIIFEEFGKSSNNIVKELTDIRSSNEVRIARVSGTIALPAMVRMITLSNVKTSDGNIRSIASYPNGITILTELIGTAEDIARYDLAVVLSDRGNSQIDPLWEPEEALPKEVYRTRLRWVWSRAPEQIIIAPEVMRYIVARANALNNNFETHIKIFGTEAWKKLTRLALATAGCLVSSDETFENLVLREEHVDFAEAFFRKIYDNDTFRLREYVMNERRYAEIDDAGIRLIQETYLKLPTLIHQLEQGAGVSRDQLMAATGLSRDELGKALNSLVRGLCIRFEGHQIIPTERFRKGCQGIDREHSAVLRIGEHIL